MIDWEPRVLPSEARCRVWAEKGGVWHLTHEDAVDGAFCMARGVRSGYQSIADKPLWRPWLKGEPAGWNATFYPMTHPPIPEGWEAVGEWRQEMTPVLTFGEGGPGYGELRGVVSDDGWSVWIRRLTPPVDWPDIPKGVELRPCVDDPDCLSVYCGEGEERRVGFVTLMPGGRWKGYNSTTGDGHVWDSQPAAIVALTGRRMG